MNIEHLEKQLRARLENHEAHDLDADLTWKAVESELDKRKKGRGLYFLLLGLGAILSLFFLSRIGSTSESNAEILPGARNSTAGLTEGAYARPFRSVDGALSITQGFEQEAIECYPCYGIKQETHPYAGEEAFAKPQAFSPVPSTERSAIPPIAFLTLKESEAKKNYVNKALIIHPKATNTRKKRSEPATALVDPIDGLPFEYLATPPRPGDLAASVNSTVENIRPDYKLELTAGLFQFTNGLYGQGSPYAHRRKQSEVPQLSWSFAANLWRTTPSGWHVGLGLEYQKTQVRFRHEEEQTTPFILENTPIHFLIDPQTRDTIARQVGNVQLEEHHQRRVQHYNTFQTLSLPVYFGFVKPTQRRVNFGLIGGVSLNYQAQQSGRLLAENGSVINFSNGSFFRRVGFSAHIQPVLVIDRGGRWEFRCSPSLAYSLTNSVKSRTDIKQHPFSYGLLLGIAKTL